MPTLRELHAFHSLIQLQKVKPKHKLRQPGRPKPPMAIEMSYTKHVRKYADDAKTVLNVVLKPHIPQLAREAGINVDSYSNSLDEMMKLVKATYGGIHSESEMKALAAEYAGKINTYNKKEVLAMMGRAIGVDIFLEDKGLAADMAAFVKQNVSLISSISEDYFDDVEGRILSGLRSGQRVGELQDVIQDRFKVPAARAELIARDQVGKFNGELMHLRQDELGIEEYVWRTVGDERVRDDHASKEGETFRWDDPPADTGHPGEDYQCRCTAEPVIKI